MTLHNKIKQTNQDELLKKMGYHNPDKLGHRTLQKFLYTDNIYQWLQTGHFDMKYGSEEFLHHLIDALALGSAYKEQIQEAKKRIDIINKMQQPYIFIDTRFKRKNEPIFALAFMEEKRRISVDKELLFYKTQGDVLDSIGNIIREHYLASGGELQLWGKIHGYVYHGSNGSRYIFNTMGSLMKNPIEIVESKAELRLKNKILNLNAVSGNDIRQTKIQTNFTRWTAKV